MAGKPADKPDELIPCPICKEIPVILLYYGYLKYVRCPQGHEFSLEWLEAKLDQQGKEGFKFV